MFLNTRIAPVVVCLAALLASSALAQPAPGGQAQQVKVRAVDLTLHTRPTLPAAAGEVPRHFANPELLREIKAAYASEKAQSAKPRRTPTPTPAPSSTPAASPAAIWTPNAAPTASISTSSAALGELDGGLLEPPDTTIASGSVSGVTEELEAVNLIGEVYPSGAQVNFAGCTPNVNTDSVSDPRVLYDAADGEWMISTTTFAPVSDAGWNLLFTRGGNPDPSAMDWYCLSILTGGIKNPDGSTGNFPDFPKLGFNSDKVVITGDAFSTIQRRFTTSYKFQGTEFVVINKSDLFGTGTTVNVSAFNPPQGDFAIEPAEHLAATSSPTTSDPDILYMASVNSAVSSTATLHLWSVAGVPGASPTITVSTTPLSIATISVPPNAQQLNGSGVLIDTNDDSLLDAVFRDGSPGSLWVSANDACTPPADSSTRSCARLIEVSINPTSATYSVAQDFDVSAGAGTYLYYPAVRTDKSGNLVTVFSGSAANASALSPGYPSVYTGVEKGVSNALSNFSLVWGGDTAYTVNPPRWGDYSGAGADPDDASIWIAGEYGTSELFFGPVWGTATARVIP